VSERFEVRSSDIELLRKAGPLTDDDRSALRDLGRRLALEAVRRISEQQRRGRRLSKIAKEKR